jgi:hypothetical protein
MFFKQVKQMRSHRHRVILQQQKYYLEPLDDVRWPGQAKEAKDFGTGSSLDPESNGPAAFHLRFSMLSEAGAVPPLSSRYHPSLHAGYVGINSNPSTDRWLEFYWTNSIHPFIEGK